jgi:peptidyl-prolyl cis-trans isomerase C
MLSRGKGLNRSKFFLAALFAVLTAGCSKTESGKTPVARLDNKTLALEEIRAHIDTSNEPSPAQIQQYIQRWLTEESLYREAVERGLDRSDEMNQKVEDVRHQLTINALLDKEVYSQQLSNFSQEEIRQYYDVHIKEFNLMHDIALVSYVLFKNRDAATEFRNLVLKGTSWSSAVIQQDSSIIMRIDSSFQTQATFMPPELWRVAAKVAVRELSFPINTDNGYYILVVWKFVRQGQIAELPMVEQEIRGRLTVERRRKLFDQLVQNLRAKHAIEVFVNSASDTGKPKIEE